MKLARRNTYAMLHRGLYAVIDEHKCPYYVISLMSIGDGAVLWVTIVLWTVVRMVRQCVSNAGIMRVLPLGVWSPLSYLLQGLNGVVDNSTFRIRSD